MPSMWRPLIPRSQQSTTAGPVHRCSFRLEHSRCLSTHIGGIPYSKQEERRPDCSVRCWVRCGVWLLSCIHLTRPKRGCIKPAEARSEQCDLCRAISAMLACACRQGTSSGMLGTRWWWATATTRPRTSRTRRPPARRSPSRAMRSLQSCRPTPTPTPSMAPWSRGPSTLTPSR